MSRKLINLSIASALILVASIVPAEAHSRRGRGHGPRISFSVAPHYYGYPPYAYFGYYSPYRYGYRHSYLSLRDIGALDLNVRPKKASVYVDGQLVGKVGRFDGFPGYLWLDEGEHQIVLHLEGFETVAKVVEVREGTLTDIRLEMRSGSATPAEEFFEVVERKKSRSRVSSPAGPEDREGPSSYSAPEGESVRARPQRDALDARTRFARMQVEITPDDAAVYLDGRLLGSVSELERLHSGILVDEGTHLLSVVRPGFEDSEVEFEAIAGEEVALKIDLQSE